MKTNDTQVTLPLREEIEDSTFLLSDYAIALGAKCSWEQQYVKGAVGRTGAFWTRRAGQQPNAIETYDRRSYREDNNLRFTDPYLAKQLSKLERKTFAHPGTEKLAVAPCIKNYVALGFNLSPAGIVKDNTLVRYPQTRLHDNALVAALTAARNTGSKNLAAVGQFNGHICYRWQGDANFYVYLPCAAPADANSVFRDGEVCTAGQGYWFKAEPLMGYYTQDRDVYAIQCQEGVTIHNFANLEQFMAKDFKPYQEIDTKQFPIGDYLQDTWLTDVTRSVAWSKAAFDQAKLHHLAAEKFANGILPQDRLTMVYDRERGN